VASILDKLGLTKNATDQSADPSSSHPVLLQAPIPDHDFLYPQKGSANAVFVFLARNSDLEGVVSSVRQMEDRFNRNYNYPWVFLNDEPFTDEFIKCVCLYFLGIY
jgi:Glycolipid 2-alpha-mannosyltransferase